MSDPAWLPLDEQYRIARNLVGRYRLDYDDAEDLIQETIIECWKAFQPVSMRFISRKMKHAFLMNYERAHALKRSAPLFSLTDPDVSSFSESLADRRWGPERLALLDEALDALEKKYPGRLQRLITVEGRDWTSPDWQWRKRHKNELSVLFNFSTNNYTGRVA